MARWNDPSIETILATVDDATILDSKSDSVTVFKAVSQLEAHYYNFGIYLKLSSSVLDSIKRSTATATGPKEKLAEVIKSRLGGLSSLTWRDIIKATEESGINSALANKIRSKLSGDELDRNLGIQDMDAILGEISDLAAHYYKLGIYLQVSPDVLDEIEGRNDRLGQVVLQFLRNVPKPTWKKVVEATFRINPALAKTIAANHQAPIFVPAEQKPPNPEVSCQPQILQSPGLVSGPAQTPVFATSPNYERIESDSSEGQIFDLCGVDTLKDNPIQLISDDEKKYLPHCLLELHRVVIPANVSQLQGNNVEIAVLDSGILLHHEVFSSKGVDQISGRNFVADDPDTLSWFTKPELHGTAVAAVAAGGTYSSVKGPCLGGIAPKAKLYICRIFANGKTKLEWQLEAFDHLIDLKQKNSHRIDIVVMSYGGPQKFKKIHNKMEALANLGVILIAAGGNDGPRADDTYFPSSDNHVISVGALDPHGNPTNFSSANCHIYAPGQFVLVPSVVAGSNTAVTKVNGTSFAAPILAGFLALFLESANGIKHIPQKAKDFVIETCHSIDFLNTLLRDHKLVRQGKLWYAHDALKQLYRDQDYIITLVQDQYLHDYNASLKN